MITDEFITLSQLLKLTDLFESGGAVKHFLQTEDVLVNQKIEHRRGRKLYPNDVVQVDEHHLFIVHGDK